LACLSSVIAREAKQSLRLSKELLRRKAPRNDRLSEQIFDNRYNIQQFVIRNAERGTRKPEFPIDMNLNSFY
jgi:hypothetical protein